MGRKRIKINVNSQTGHSFLLWLGISIVTAGLGLIVMLYFTFSSNHYWHL